MHKICMWLLLCCVFSFKGFFSVWLFLYMAFYRHTISWLKVEGGGGRRFPISYSTPIFTIFFTLIIESIIRIQPIFQTIFQEGFLSRAYLSGGAAINLLITSNKPYLTTSQNFFS